VGGQGLEDLLDLLGTLGRRDEQGVLGVDDDEVVDADERHEPASGRGVLVGLLDEVGDPSGRWGTLDREPLAEADGPKPAAARRGRAFVTLRVRATGVPAPVWLSRLAR
jgi:hypothetical protein